LVAGEAFLITRQGGNVHKTAVSAAKADKSSTRASTASEHVATIADKLTTPAAQKAQQARSDHNLARILTNGCRNRYSTDRAAGLPVGNVDLYVAKCIAETP